MKFRLDSIEPENAQPPGHDPADDEETFYDPATADDRYFTEPKRRFGVWRTAVVVVVMGVCAGGLLLAYRHSGGGSTGGPIPLIRADQKAVKERPSNAGGATVPNQDKYVYNPNQPEGKVERLLPPPETPLPKPVAPPVDATRTVAIPPADPVPAQPPAAQGAPTPANQTPATSAQATSTQATSTQATSTQATSSRSSAAPVPASPAPDPVKPAPVGAPVSVAAAPPAPAPAKSGAPAALHPPANPATAAAPAAGGGVAGAAAPAAGGIRVQVAATRTEDAGKQEWDRLKRSNADLLGSFSATTVRADLGDRGIFYRVQAGPIADAATAEKLCAELKRRNIGCLLVQ